MKTRKVTNNYMNNNPRPASRWTKKRIREWLIDVMLIYPDNKKEAMDQLDFLIKELDSKKK